MSTKVLKRDNWLWLSLLEGSIEGKTGRLQ